VPKLLAIGATCGIAWGAIAVLAVLAMFSGLLPAPGGAGFPVAIVLVLLYFPFLVAAGILTGVTRSSPAFAEIIGVTIASGAGLGLLMSAGIALARRLARNRRNRG
jgi:hypothetical protein